MTFKRLVVDIIGKYLYFKHSLTFKFLEAKVERVLDRAAANGNYFVFIM
jgi:hypothetical protein